MAYPKLTDQPGALETAAAVKAGDISPLEAVEAAIARIEKLDMHVDAVVVCDFERALETARAMDGQAPRDDQPLFGVPMTVKESFDIADLPTTFGHEQFADNLAGSDAKLVSQLKAAGAIIIGKTNVPIDLSDWQSFNAVYGRTNNPHDHGRSPGGSSGGSAAAVAAGMVPCEIGTDIGGSVRVPAHFCGVWGHKPSWGVLSKCGHQHPALGNKSAHDGVLSVAGPLARNGADIDALMRLLSQVPLASDPKPLKECRLLLLLEYPGAELDDSVRAPIEAAAAALEAAGVRIDRSTEALPDLARQQENYLRMLNTAMARGAPAPDGKRASATDWFNMLDAQARNEMEWERLFETYDAVLCPPAPVLAIPHHDGQIFQSTLSINGKDVDASTGLVWAGIATYPNLPGTVLPIGESGNLPCGLQVIAPRWRDLDGIAIARGIDAIVNA